MLQIFAQPRVKMCRRARPLQSLERKSARLCMRTKEAGVIMVARLFFAVVALSVCSAGYSNSGPLASLSFPDASTDLDCELEVDTTPPGIVPSSQCTVRLRHHHRWVRSFVYQVQNPGFSKWPAKWYQQILDARARNFLDIVFFCRFGHH